jgi:hypothetical protein
MSSNPLLPLLVGLWRGLQRFTHGIFGAMTYAAMSFVYWAVVGPVALGFKLLRPDPTDRGLGDRLADSYSQEVKRPAEDIRRAQRPY